MTNTHSEGQRFESQLSNRLSQLMFFVVFFILSAQTLWQSFKTGQQLHPFTTFHTHHSRLLNHSQYNLRSWKKALLSKQTNRQPTHWTTDWLINSSIDRSINQSIKECYLCCGSSTNGIPNSLLEFCSGPSSSSTRKPNSSNLKIKNVTISKPT